MKISPLEYYNFCVEYYNGSKASQRLGQAFINKFFPASGEESADLFYEEDSIKAESMIMERYVDYGD